MNGDARKGLTIAGAEVRAIARHERVATQRDRRREHGPIFVGQPVEHLRGCVAVHRCRDAELLRQRFERIQDIRSFRGEIAASFGQYVSVNHAIVPALEQ